MAELLLELLSEEIPARMQARAAQDLKRLVRAGLDKAQLSHERADAFVTPRRLVLVVDGLPTAQPDVSEERRGPRADAPAQAIEGFLKSAGLTRDQVEERETPKGTFLFGRIEKKGHPTREVLPSLIDGVLTQMPWPKSMRWATTTASWVRPLHNILAVFDGTPLEGSFSFGGSGDGAGADGVSDLRFTATTLGHRFLAPDPFAVSGFADYMAKLTDAKVMVDPEERRAVIVEQAGKLAAAEGLTIREDPGLLDEVVGLVEWPVVMMGRIDDAFMAVPPEVLITAMRTHQKYFSLLDGAGAMAPRFLVVANTEASDGGKQVIAGNERVLRARLADAKFFWDQDRKKTLESRIDRLAERIFHAKLGTDRERVERIAKLAREWAGACGADPVKAERAARLCKADLMTEMVGELPELQGLMGRYYALNDGEDAEVAQAIADHYSPQGPGDDCPSAPVSADGGAGGQDRYARRVFLHRPEAHRIEGSVRASPGRARRDPADRGKQASRPLADLVRRRRKAPSRTRGDDEGRTTGQLHRHIRFRDGLAARVAGAARAGVVGVAGFLRRPPQGAPARTGNPARSHIGGFRSRRRG